MSLTRYVVEMILSDAYGRYVDSFVVESPIFTVIVVENAARKKTDNISLRVQYWRYLNMSTSRVFWSSTDAM